MMVFSLFYLQLKSFKWVCVTVKWSVFDYLNETMNKKDYFTHMFSLNTWNKSVT